MLLFVFAALVALAFLPVRAVAENGATTTTTGSSAAATVALEPKPTPSIGAKAAILMDMDTGRVLYEKNPDDRRPFASTTKIMTGLVALETLKLDTVVEASENACAAGECEMWLEPGENISVDMLLYGLLVRSGNDAAVALAEASAGTVKDFVKLMNEKAASLGLENTHFTNPHGLDGDEHYSSSRDLALLGIEAMKNAEFRRYVATETAVIPFYKQEGNRRFGNHNNLLGKVPYVNGIKTGFTGKAGWCLVVSGTLNGASLIGVVLGGETQDSRDQDAARLMEFGFSRYQERVLVEKGAALAQAPVPYHYGKQLPLVAENPLSRTLYFKEKVESSLQVDESIVLPIKQGQIMGKMTYFVEKEPVGEVPLVASEDIGRATLGVKVKYFWALFTNWVGGIV